MMCVRVILIVLVFFSCNSKVEKKNEQLNISFQYILQGGEGKLISNYMGEEIVESKELNDTIEIDVYKWLGVPIDSYNGKCELRSDTLLLHYWEEMPRESIDFPHAALVSKSKLVYKIKKVKYRSIVVLMDSIHIRN